MRRRGDVTRVVPLSDETAEALRRYWSDCPACAGPLIRNQRHTSEGIGADYISNLVGRWFREAGVKAAKFDGKSAHALRHTAIQDVVNGGAPVQVAQKFAGHAAISTTMIYLRGEVEGLREAVGGRRYAT